MKLNIDKAGRIILPKPMRDELRLEPGDALEIERSGAEKARRLGYRAGEPLSAAIVDNTIRRVRDEREAGNIPLPDLPRGR